MTRFLSRLITSFLTLLVLSSSLSLTRAQNFNIIPSGDEICAGVFSASDFGISSPVSNISIVAPSGQTGKLSFVIYNYEDAGKIGAPLKKAISGDPYKLILNDKGDRLILCNDEAIKQQLCEESKRGQILVEPEPANTFAPVAYQASVELNGKPQKIPGGVDVAELPENAQAMVVYEVKTTGYYCLNIFAGEMSIDVAYHNPYGLLLASDYPKLKFYMWMSIAYVAVFAFWAYLSWRHWHVILPLQNYMSLLIISLVFAMAANYGFWDNINHQGSPSRGLLAVTVALDAARTSMSFFMMLLVALGYGVVKPVLSRSVMRGAWTLTALHFVSGCLYGAGSNLRDPESVSLLALIIFVLPQALTLTVFYVWIMNGLLTTTSVLEVRRQTFKLQMYRRLTRLIIAAAVIIIVFVAANILGIWWREDPRIVARRWRWKWLLQDAWIHLLYGAVLLVILWWWRPTAENYRFGLDELAMTEEDADDREQIDIRLEAHGEEEAVRMQERAAAYGHDGVTSRSTQSRSAATGTATTAAASAAAATAAAAATSATVNGASQPSSGAGGYAQVGQDTGRRSHSLDIDDDDVDFVPVGTNEGNHARREQVFDLGDDLSDDDFEDWHDPTATAASTSSSGRKGGK
ncbi:hypothetical protein GQ42DRAFT_163066 [Ramicandelaber brevisporus]|nr:hypothetical protein GQ42DRAFT_163066 [Ramicandelaber brevisporus]